MKYYLAYGSNMNINQMSERCPGAKLFAKGIVRDYKLQFRGRGHANIFKSQGNNLNVVVWEISQDCEKALDLYESFPDYYIKKELQVDLGSETIEAMAYLMTEEEEKIRIRPMDEYIDSIMEGYRANGIEDEPLRLALEENEMENK